MTQHSLTHLSDSTLEHDLRAAVSRERGVTAEVVAHLAEFDARKLYLPAAYPSMYAYCVGELRMSEDSACKRIRAARAARQFPAIFRAVAEGRLHLSAVVLLAPHLTPETAGDLMAAATHRSKPEIERLLAQRFPRPDLPTRLEALALPRTARECNGSMIPDTVGLSAPGRMELPVASAPDSSVPGRMEFPASPPESSAPGRIEPTVPRARVAPLAPKRFALQVTIGQGTHDKLRRAQELLGHQVPPGDVAEVLDRALDALIERLEKRKFAATDRPRQGQPRAETSGRHIPAEVKRAVWKRDGGRCTFVSHAGRRCAERSGLEFDHATEFARGGQATVSGMRLRCRAHNQHGAECTYGVEFMRRRRHEVRQAMAQARANVGRAGPVPCSPG